MADTNCAAIGCDEAHASTNKLCSLAVPASAWARSLAKTLGLP
jgi:hypothetical protein